MVFSSPLFICLFLPTTIILHLILPPKVRNLWLLAASLVFYLWGEPRYFAVLLATSLLDYIAGLLLEKFRRPKDNSLRKGILIATIVPNIACLCFFKYTNLVLSTVNKFTSASIPLLNLALPIGISFYTFQALSYVIDVYRHRVSVQRSFVNFFMYVTLFPQLIAGPIVRYADVEKSIQHRSVRAASFFNGLCRFCIGLGKKVLLADTMARIIRNASANAPTVALAWCSSLAFMFQIYFDFSGYSDMAIGLGKMLGFRFPENFLYPYEAQSITDFWRRWHITLSSWFREYLYIPLGGNRRGLKRQVWNLLIVWVCTGLWHGGAWNFLLWGLYYFAMLTLEKLFLGRLLEKLPAILRRAYALIVVFFGWVLFAAEGEGALGSSFSSLFGINTALCSEYSLFVLSSSALSLLICAVASTHFPALVANKCLSAVRSANAAACIKGIYCLCVFVLAVAFLVGGSYSPFLYFRF